MFFDFASGLLKYEHDFWSGLLYISYEIFSFDIDGNKIIFDEERFMHGMPPDPAFWADYVCSFDEIYTFADKVNKYLDSSFVLLSTWNFILRYSTPDNLITEQYIVPIEEIESFNEEVREYLETLIITTWYADLTHTGTMNKIVINPNDISDGYYGHSINIYGDNGEFIYSHNLTTMHVHAINIQLYTDKDGKDYIMTWLQDFHMGIFEIYYEIFSFDAEGNKIIFDKDSFHHGFTPNMTDLEYFEFPLDEIYAFAEKLNNYLADSFLLLSTVRELSYSTPDNKITEQFIVPIDQLNEFTEYVNDYLQNKEN